MDTDDEYISPAVADEPTYTSHGGMFAGSQNFTVGGGTFINTTNVTNTSPGDPPNFRMIPWGDIFLQQELSPGNQPRVVGRRPQSKCARRVYSAKIDGRHSDVTVAVYQGDGAEEAWRRDIATYMSLRHSSIIQVCAGASYGNIHATVFHGDLVPFKQFMAAQSPNMTVYRYAQYQCDWTKIENYFVSAFGDSQLLDALSYILWIQSSTGRMSADLLPHNQDDPDVLSGLFDSAPPLPGTVSFSFNTMNGEAIDIKCLSLEAYHCTCDRYLLRYLFEPVPSHTTATLASVFIWPTQPGTASEQDQIEMLEIASLPHTSISKDGWYTWQDGNKITGHLMENSWIRYPADVSFDNDFSLEMAAPDSVGRIWLGQANCVFKSLRVESQTLEDYVLMNRVGFEIFISNPTVDHCPPGYLFLCPAEDSEVSPTSFRWPDSPMYWSLDPSGVERLSVEEATQLGFPSFQLTMRLGCSTWDTTVYAGLRQFHAAKGFDPESQDVARHVGHPLYQLSDPQFVHVNELDEEDQSGNAIETDEDLEKEHPEDELCPCSALEIDGETLILSKTDKILMSVKLALMLFLAMCWVHANLM
ncbi:hypothetical protein C8R46DRAFT_1092936 [Mycena filopes]|nr:hypothetical protein C8R46DRAFT_1092936 [Mycena filopes]